MALQQPDSGYPDSIAPRLTAAPSKRVPARDARPLDRHSVTDRRRDAAAWRAYRDQTVPAQRLFGLLRSLPGVDHGVTGLGAAMALGGAETSVLLATLVEGDLIVRVGSAYGVARYAVTPVGAALRPEWSGAETRSVQRWYDWCLAHASAAADLLYPQALRLDATATTTIPVVPFTTAAQASDWLDAEIDTLHSAVHNARRLGLGRFAWLLADALRGRAWQDPYRVKWIAAADAAVAAALAVGGPRDAAAAYLCLADACFLAGELDRAEEACVALGANAARAGWLSGCAASYANRGGISHRRGDLDRALRDYAHALELSAAAGRTATQATLYNNVGSIKRIQGDLGEAVTLHRRALVIFRQVGSMGGEARTLELLAQACAAAGSVAAAERALLQAFMVYGRLGDRTGEARTRAKVGGMVPKRAA
jgi:tetratricopeptide (TPR) repeat protein